MRTHIIAAVLASAFSTASAAQCNADNCARAATGTFGGLQSSRFAACSSFQRCTVTPAATTTTTTVTATPPPILQTVVVSTETDVLVIPITISQTLLSPVPSVATVQPARRVASNSAVTNCPTAIPSFASVCSSSRYASACSCAGYTKSYVTASTPVAGTTTVTVTAAPVLQTIPVVVTTAITEVSTITQVVTPPVPSSQFRIQVNEPGNEYDGYYVALSNSDPNSNQGISILVSPITQGTSFNLDTTTGELFFSGSAGPYWAYTLAQADPDFLRFSTESSRTTSDADHLTCIVDPDNSLECLEPSSARTSFLACESGALLFTVNRPTLAFGDAGAAGDGCSIVNVQAAFV